MSDEPLFWVVAVSCLAVAGILTFGIATFGKGGDFNRKYANKIMRWRVGAQLVAVILILAFVWFRREGGG